jgi:hypothetical protein
MTQTRRAMITSAAAVCGLTGTLGLEGCSQEQNKQVADQASDTFKQVAPVAEVALKVIYGLALAAGKGLTRTGVLLEAGSIISEAASNMAKGLSPTASPTPAPVDATAPSPSDGTPMANTVIIVEAEKQPVSHDVAIAPRSAATHDLTANVTFLEPPVLTGMDRASTSFYLTPVAWDHEQRPYYGRPVQVEMRDMQGAFSLYAPDWEQPEIPRPGLYRLGYRLWEVEGGPDLMGSGPVLHVLADEEWAYDEILREPNVEARPDALVYSRTYAYQPGPDPILASLEDPPSGAPTTGMAE